MMFKNIGLCVVLLASICSVAEQIASAAGQAVASTALSYIVFALLVLFVAAALCIIAWSAFARRLWLMWKVSRAEKYGVGDEMQELGATEFASHRLHVVDLEDEKTESTMVADAPGGFTKLASRDSMAVVSKTDGVRSPRGVVLESPDSRSHARLLAADAPLKAETDERGLLPGEVSSDV